MDNVFRRGRIQTLLLLLAGAMMAGLPAFAQTDFSGEWVLRTHEDPGQPPLGNYLGLPLNEAGRQRAETTAESILGIPEFQCRPHSAPHQWRGVGGMRFMKEVDPVSRDLTAYHVQYWRSKDRPIYLDGRPHPPAYAPHSWTGFSTGKWAGNTLVVTTTHLKEGFLTRGGPQTSDYYTMTEYIMRHGDYLTVMMIVDDPIYLDEPFVQTSTFQLDIHTQLALEPCTASLDENGGGDPHAVPHYLPGRNPYLTEWLERDSWVPEVAARGGAETMYPEYRLKLDASDSAEPVAMPFSRPAFSVRVADLFPHDGEVHVLPVQGNIYMLIVDGVNVTVSVGPQGVMLVDTGPAHMTDKLHEAVHQLATAAAASPAPNNCRGTHCPGIPWGWSSPFMNTIISSPAPPKPIRYIINTSAAPDRIAGNEKLAAAGFFLRGGGSSSVSPEVAGLGAAVIGHENVLNRMSAPTGNEAPTPVGAWPTDTYWRSFYKLSEYFNGEAVVVYHQPEAHSDGDSIVFFRGSDVISAGNLFWTTSYPFIDLENGGSIQGVISGLNQILDIAVAEFRGQGGTWIIPGRGRLSDAADVAFYRNMVVMIRDRIQDMIRSGMTLDEVKAARPTMDFDGRYGSDRGAWTTDMFVEAVYRSLTGQSGQELRP